jgi:phage shock protein C
MQEKRLVRSTTNKMIGGVAAGMAEYFSMDVTLMRLIWVLLGIFIFPVAEIAYIVMMVVLPEGVGGSTSGTSGGAGMG